MVYKGVPHAYTSVKNVFSLPVLVMIYMCNICMDFAVNMLLKTLYRMCAIHEDYHCSTSSLKLKTTHTDSTEQAISQYQFKSCFILIPLLNIQFVIFVIHKFAGLFLISITV